MGTVQTAEERPSTRFDYTTNLLSEMHRLYLPRLLTPHDGTASSNRIFRRTTGAEHHSQLMRSRRIDSIISDRLPNA